MKELKNWLIRTNDQYILGPISKNKIKNLLENNYLESTDEICSGNGFWFYVREKDLIQKYINENFIQGFNPISEALKVGEDGMGIVNDILIPSVKDLEYPDDSNK